MAADAVWRSSSQVGVTIATSGPGATNLITGIACSWFDSIPSIHITGQVNQSESREELQANVRQAGFQETDIVSMVRPITKMAIKITSLEHLLEVMPQALVTATSGRMGPVLLDVPMNIQKEIIDEARFQKALRIPEEEEEFFEIDDNLFSNFFIDAQRPLVIIGAGAALFGKSDLIQKWCENSNIPYVSSWGSMPYLDRSAPNYQGSLGVYGSRHANWTVQSSDKIIVLGSRLDNRQRTGNANGFAPYAKMLVLDIDTEELKKFKSQKNYQVQIFDLRNIENLVKRTFNHNNWDKWLTSLNLQKNEMDNGFKDSTSPKELNPYEAVVAIQKKFKPNSIVVSDCGANLCWVYQSYQPDDSFLFTAGGNSPMAYSLPAAIGAQIVNPSKKVYCFIGDGGFQMNIQELQTIVHYKLPIVIIIQNNFGYGIIKQFQDSYFEGRYHATGIGYSTPDFEKIITGYGIPYQNVQSLKEIEDLVLKEGPQVIDLHLPENALITPKTEMDRFIHDQFPYIQDGKIAEIPFNYPDRPSKLSGTSNPTV
jgi:acetolactate synthase-1/2/3 large subunit